MRETIILKKGKIGAWREPDKYYCPQCDWYKLVFRPFWAERNDENTELKKFQAMHDQEMLNLEEES